MFTDAGFEQEMKTVREDLERCAEYKRVGTLQAAFRYMDDLRMDQMRVLNLVEELYNRMQETP